MNTTPKVRNMPGQKSLRSACDLCHQGKIKCSGGTVCEGCERLGVKCTYSTSNRTGRPKGVKNKKTLERIKQLRTANSKDERGGSLDSQTASRQSSISRGSPNERAKPIPHSTTPSLPETESDANLASPIQFWDPFPMEDMPDCSGPRTGDIPSSPGVVAFNPNDVSGDIAPDLSWIGSLLNSSDLMLPRTDEMDTALGGERQTSPIQMPNCGNGAAMPQINPFPTCNCVQQLSDQLANFKSLSRCHRLLRPDFVLSTARDALSKWQIHQECQTCQQNNDKDILVLSVMALRALLHVIQETGLHHDYQASPAMSDDAAAQSGSSTPVFNAEQSFLGTYQLACEEKRLVVDLLLHRTLKHLNRTIENLRQKSLGMTGLSRRRGTISSRSSRSESNSLSMSAGSSTLCCGMPGDFSFGGGVEELDLAGDDMPLDAHDNYLQESLQNSSETLESLLTRIQSLSLPTIFKE